MKLISKATARYERTVARTRERSAVVDHLWRARERYGEALGGRLAAAIAYFGFFATFALSLVGYAVLGFVVERHAGIGNTVDEFLQENLPILDTAQIAAARGTAGLVGLVGLVLTGVGWVEALRSSQRHIWRMEEQPGGALLRRAVDVVVLVALALLLGASIAVAAGVERLLAWLPAVAQTGVGWLLAIAVNLVLAVALLAALPRLRISARRLLPPAGLVAVGIFLLNSLGQLYIGRVQDNPAYALVATAAGLLVYLYLFNQVLLVGAALAATSRHGRVVDLAARAGPDGGVEADPDDARAAGSDGPGG